MSLAEKRSLATRASVSDKDRRGADAEPPPERNRLRWSFVALALTIVLCGAIRWRLRDMPLERDEGEYAYAGQLLLQAIPPYQIAYNMKLPGTYAAYAVIMAVFGQTAGGIRIGLLFANALTILLVYGVGRQIFGELAGAVAGVSYGILSIGPGVNGFAAHATHFVVLGAMAGLWLLCRGIARPSSRTLFLAGLFMGLAFLMKQPGAAFGIFGGLYLLRAQDWSKDHCRGAVRQTAWYIAGAVLPYGLTCLALWRAGVFAKFWFWTVDYALQYGSNAGHAALYFLNNVPQIIHSAIALWLLASVGLTAFFWNPRVRPRAEFLGGLFLFSGLAVSAGFYFRFHYFILLLPALSFSIGIAVSSATAWAEKPAGLLPYFPVSIFVLCCISALLQQEYFFFRADPISASRQVYPADPFPEAAAVSLYIEQHTSPADSIAVLGSEPQIFFYSRRHAATGYLYSYSLMEEQKYAPTMQREEISEIEARRPVYIVFASDWMILPHSDRTFLRWADQYLKQNYELIGVMRERDGLQLRATGKTVGEHEYSNGSLFVFRRIAS